jgi:hypothetical protein
MVRYGGGDIVEVRIRDGSGRTTDKFICNGDDEKELSNILLRLKSKYGLRMIENKDVDWVDTSKNDFFDFG